ncbi:hypothetical protein BDW22DRAFT_1358489 [Trametopsis cervina]|nr:hypothetical protein BDW22DRAFT_1358489 [Trametopsis cervina]
MSSGDELGGYEAATSAPAKKGPPRGARAAPRTVAGPSKPLDPAAAKKGGKTAQEEDSTRDVVVLSSDEDGQKAATKDAKGKKKETVVNTKTMPQVNGKGKAKGKAKADTSTQAMEIDEPPSAADAAPTRTTKTTRTTVKPISEIPSPPPAKRHKAESALEAEVARLRRRLDDVAAQRDRLSEQLKEALEIRESEPERLLAEGMAQFEASMQAQQHLLQEQATSLAQLKALPDTRQLHTLQFITRDVAAEESKGLTDKMKKLEQNLKEKNAQVTDLEAKNRELDKQLAAEIQMAKEYREKNQLNSKAGANASSRQPNVSTSALDADVIMLYEDLTNFLVTKVVRGPAKFPTLPDLQEKTFYCSYTHMDAKSTGSNPSLRFTLRHLYGRSDEDDPSPPTSRKDLVEKMEYIPLNLENESEEFKKRIDFLTTAFIFERDQMHVFMTTLSDRMARTNDDSEEEDQLDETA